MKGGLNMIIAVIWGFISVFALIGLSAAIFTSEIL